MDNDSKPWPWNKLRNPTPADWGIGMTICISAMCEPTRDERYIVTACDKMVSMSGYFSGDDVVRKIDPVAYGWTSMIAGNDVSPAIPILDKVEEYTDENPDPETLSSMTKHFKLAYKGHRLEVIEDEILGPSGFTWDTFRRDAKAQLTDQAYARMLDQIRAYELDLSFIVSGFDAAGHPHIFTVSNPGKCDYYDKLGFWAIGSGQHQAIASMFANQYSKHGSLERCVAKVLAAKLTAETASGVGKTTWLMVHLSDPCNRTIHVSQEAMNNFRQEWNSLPRLPMSSVTVLGEDIAEQKKTILEAEANPQRSIAQTSAGQQ